MGAAGVDAAGGHLEDPHGSAAHAVTAPAENHSVDPPGQDPLQQHLALFLMKQPTENEVHQAGKLYLEFADKTKETR